MHQRKKKKKEGTEALQLLQSWTTAIWGDPIRLVEVEDLQDTVPWEPPAAAPMQVVQEEAEEEEGTRGEQTLWSRAGAKAGLTRPKPEGCDGQE